MAQKIINTSTPNDGLGDPLRDSFNDTNDNFTELYTNKVDKIPGKGLSTNDYSDAELTKLASIEAFAEVNVQPDWNQNDNTADDYIKNKPDLDQYVNAIGFIDYADSATAITPLTVVANTPLKLTNDGLGANSNYANKPYGVTDLWNTTFNEFDFTQLEVGDLVKIRFDLDVTSGGANQTAHGYMKLGVGSPSEFQLSLGEGFAKSAGSHDVVQMTSLYIGSEDIRDYPAEVYFLSDGGGTLVVNGWYVEAVRRNVNVTEIALTGESGLLDGEYEFSTGTTGASATTGKIAFNNASPASVTELFINKTNSKGVDVAYILNSMKEGDIFYFADKNFTAKYIKLKVSGTKTNNTTYFTFPVTVENNGTAISNNTITSYSLSLWGGLETAVEKTTLIDNDEMLGRDSANAFSSIKTKMSDVWTYIKSKADSFYVTLTGNQTVSGVKTFVNTGTTQTNGIILTNNGTTVNAYPLEINNNASGRGVIVSNISSGRGVEIINNSNGKGEYIDNSGSGTGLEVSNSGAGVGIFGNTASSGYASYFQTTLGGKAVVANGTTASSGDLYTGQNNGTDTFKVTKQGNVTANSYIKSGGTSAQFLMADGSVSAGSGISDGDKGDITVSSGGTIWEIDADTIGLTELSATGTADSTTFLRGDNTWATPSGGGIADLQEGYEANPTILTDATNDALKVQQGSGSDSDTIFEGLNGAGVVTSSIDGRGYSNVVGHIKRNVDIGGAYSLGIYVTKTSSGVFNYFPSSAATSLGGVLIRESYAIDGKGDILIQGTVKGLDTSSFSLGNTLYPNMNTGVLTTTVPYNYTRYVQVGKVSVVDAVNGEIEVDLLKGYHPVPTSAYSFIAQNGSSASGALPTNQAYRNEVENAYTDTPVWNGTAPSGSTNNTYSFLTLGNRCGMSVNLTYASSGATNSQVTIPLPSDAPTPKAPSGFGGASGILYIGVGRIIANQTSLPTTGILTCYLRVNSSNSGYEIVVITGTAIAATGALAYINYPTS